MKTVDLIAVDNVLLSADCRDAFLCDFGLSETSDCSGRSTKAFRGESGLKLTLRELQRRQTQ